MSRDESTQQLAKDPLVGEMLGPYEVIARVAEGGMGVILAAQHTKIGRRVAIKLLRDDLVKNKDQVSRFLNEAKTVNRVGHPNIIQIYDFIEDWEREPPLVYMVMEYLVGRNLHEYVDAMSCLSADETIDIADEICAALVAMHDVNVLHLDLKPHNIFLASGDTSVREQRVKLLDFGVSRVFAEGQRVELTDPGQLIGTPKYMAPEQILGRPLDVRADIYALGLVMYKMLVGDLFIQAEEVGALLVEQVHTEPPSEIIAGDGRRVPPVLEKVVHRCLRKVAAERYGSARELRDALRLARASQTGKVAALPEGDATGEMTLRSGGAMRAAVVVLLVLLCGGGLWLWLRGGTGGNRRARAAGSGSASASGSATAAAMRADAAAGRTDSAALKTAAQSADASAKTLPDAARASAADVRARPRRKNNGGRHRAGNLVARHRKKKPPHGASPGSGRAAVVAKKPAAKAGTAKGSTKGPPKGSGHGAEEAIRRGGTLDPFGSSK